MLNHLTSIPNIDWQKVLHISCLEHVNTIIFKNLSEAFDIHKRLPPEIVIEFEDINHEGQTEQSQRALRALNVIDYFNSTTSFTVMAIKGWAHTLVMYSGNWLTYSHDIDLIINGARSKVDIQAIHRLKQEGALEGLEIDFIEHHDANMNGLLRVNFTEIWTDAIDVSVCRTRFHVPCPEDMLILACINVARKRLRLKNIFDVSELASKPNFLNWAKVERKARNYNCTTIVYLGLKAAKNILGCPIPEGITDALGINPAHQFFVDKLLKLSIKYSYNGHIRESRIAQLLDMRLLAVYMTYDRRLIWNHFDYFLRRLIS